MFWKLVVKLYNDHPTNNQVITRKPTFPTDNDNSVYQYMTAILFAVVENYANFSIKGVLLEAFAMGVTLKFSKIKHIYFFFLCLSKLK